MEVKGIDEGRMYSIKEVTQILPISTSSVYKLVREGKISAKRFGGRIFVCGDVLVKLMQDEGD